MTILNDAARRALTSGRLAHLVTLDSDGSPQVSCVYVGLDGDDIVCGHLAEYRKVRNVRRDGRVALSMEAEGAAAPGFANYLVVSGAARVEAGARRAAPQADRRLLRARRGVPAPRGARGLRHPHHARERVRHRPVGGRGGRRRLTARPRVGAFMQETQEAGPKWPGLPFVPMRAALASIVCRN